MLVASPGYKWTLFEDNRLRRLAIWAILIWAVSFVAVRLGFWLGGAAENGTLLEAIQFTVAYIVGAVISWIGVADASERDRRSRTWLAWGATMLAAGQVSWDIQDLLRWTTYPGPSEIFFQGAAIAAIVALAVAIHSQSTALRARAAVLDAIAVALAGLTVLIPVVVQPSSNVELLPVFLEVALLGSMLIVLALSLVTAVQLGIRASRGRFLFLASLFGFVGLVTSTYPATVANGIPPGSLMNSALATLAVIMGLGVCGWTVSTKSRKAPRWVERLMSALPYVVDVVVVGGMLYISGIAGIAEPILRAAQISGLSAILITVFRQGLILTDEQRIREAQQDLLKSRQELTTMLRAANVGVWELDTGSSMCSWDELAGELIGAPKGLQSGSLAEYYRRVHPDDIRRVKQAAIDCVAEASSYSVEVRVRRPEGGWRWVRSAGHASVDSESSTVVVRGYIMDVTQQKRAEEAQRARESAMASLIDGLPGPAILIDRDARVVTANRGMISAFGQETLDDVRGQVAWTFMSEPVRSVRQQKFEQALQSKSGFTYEDCNGGRTFETTVNPILDEDGDVVQVAILAIDVTEARRAAEELRDRDIQIQTLGDNLVDGVLYRVMRDHDGTMKFLYMSKGVERVHGVSQEDVARDPQLIYDQILPSHREEIAHLEDVSCRNMTPFLAEVPFVLPSGEHRWVLARSFPRKLDDGRTIWEGIELDITDRKLAGEALTESHAQYADLVNSIDGIVWEAEIPSYAFTFVSKQAESILGFPVEEWFSVPRFWTSRLHPEDLERARDYCYACMAAGLDHDVEYRLIAKDGHVVWVRDIVTVTSLNGRPHKARGIMVDVTQRKAADDAIRLGEARYRSLIDAAPDAIVVLDAETGIFVDYNPQAALLFGADPTEMLAKGPIHFSPEFQPDGQSSHDKAIAYIKSAVEGETITFEWLHQTSQGDLIPCEVKLSRLPSEDRLLIRGSVTDISERKAAEAAIRASDERFHQIVSSSLDAVIAVDSRSVIKEWNHEAERIFGYTSDEAIGQYMPTLVIPAEYQTAHEEGIDRFLNTGYSDILGQRIEIEGRRKDGTVFPIELSVTSIGEGERLIFSAFVRDLTEAKRSQSERERLESQLTQAQKLEAVGTLAAGIAHDFNNLLGSIRGNVELLASDLPDGHAGMDSVEELRKAGTRATQLVQQILAFTRDREAPTSLVDIGPVVAEAVTVLKKSAPPNIVWDESIGSEHGLIKADPTQILQVVLNLGQNAIHAVRAHGGRITVRLQQTVLGESASDIHPDLTPGPYRVLLVKDDGVGMEEETIDRIFEPFFTTKRTGEGTGLGLAVVHGIAQNHNAVLTVSSEPGFGTEFRIYFPLLEGFVEDVIESRPTPIVSGNGKRILYIDDEESLVYLVKRVLAKSGFDVVGFDDPVEALTEFAKDPSRFDCVVTDFNMPQLSGLDVIMRVRAIRPDVPIAMTSGYISEDLRSKVVDLGEIELLYKPNTVDKLGHVIEQAILKSGVGQPN